MTRMTNMPSTNDSKDMFFEILLALIYASLASEYQRLLFSYSWKKARFLRLVNFMLYFQEISCTGVLF